MTPRRLHAACPVCQRAEALRPDGTMLQHTAPHPSGRWRVCPGTGRDPGADAVRAWLAGHESDAADALRVQIEARRRIVRAVRSLGSNASDVRDAAHEATHGLTLDLPQWDPRSVDRALMRLRPRARMGHEVTARAVEAVVCARLGEDHSVEENAVLTALEAARDGAAVDAMAFAAKVRAAMTTPQVLGIAERVCALGDEG